MSGIADFKVSGEMLKEVFQHLPEDTEVLHIQDAPDNCCGNRLFIVRVWSASLPEARTAKVPTCKPQLCRVQDGIYFESWGVVDA